MENEKQQADGSANNANPSQPQQNAQVELNQMAQRANAAAQDFNFNKLFEGRVDNVNYFYAAIAFFALGLILRMIPVIGWIISLAFAVIGVGMTIRRFHDINVTGWATLATFVPVLGFLVVVYLCWKIGDTTPNQYGPVPDKKRDFFRAVLNT